MGSPIKDHPRAAVIGGQFPSPDAARHAAEQCKRTLLYWAVKYRHGIDFGDGRQRSIATNAGLKMLEEEHGCPFRNDVHGIDVYEHIENLRFVHTSVAAQVEKHPRNLLEAFANEFEKDKQLSEKQVLASEIYASSWFDITHRSRFITLVTAVEALLEPTKHPDPVQELIDEFGQKMASSIRDERIKNSLQGSLQRLRHQSIGQAGRELSQTLLPERSFHDQSAADFFGKCYALRSEILHEGTTEGDVWQLAGAMEEFVAHLLIASLDRAQPAVAADAAAPRG